MSEGTLALAESPTQPCGVRVKAALQVLRVAVAGSDERRRAVAALAPLLRAADSAGDTDAEATSVLNVFLYF